MKGMEMPVEIWMRNTDLIKTVAGVNGQDIVQAFDREKGYMINPVAGSNVPVEMNPDRLKDVIRTEVQRIRPL
jgi:hypothetical protein